MLFDAVEGLPDRKLERLFAGLMALLANLNRDPKQTPTPYKLEQFEVDYGWQAFDETIVLTEDERIAEARKVMQMLAIVFGSKVVRSDN